MAFLMTDAAAGSEAAMKLMQNMGAAPLAEQVGKAQAEQVIANTERSKLQNLVTDQGIKTTADIKAKTAALIQDKAYQSSSDGDKQRKLAGIFMEAGQVEEGSKLLTAAENTEAKAVATQQKQMDVQAQAIGNAYGVLSAVPDAEVDSFFQRLPQAQQKALVDQVGENNWNRMSGAEKKEASKNLMLNAKGQLATRLKELDYDRQLMVQQMHLKLQMMRESGLMQRKLMGGSRDDMKDWEAVERRIGTVDSNKAATERLKVLDQAVDAAQAKKDKAWMFDSSESDALTKAINNRAAFLREQAQKKLNIVASAPDFEGKQDMLDMYKQERDMYPAPEGTPSPVKVEESSGTKSDKTGKADTAVSSATPAATTENKGTQAPFEATSYLKNNPTEENKKFFKEKYGYLPEGLEAKDTRKYTRTKGTRGNWVYTPTNKGGKTKEEWAKQDEMGK